MAYDSRQEMRFGAHNNAPWWHPKEAISSTEAEEGYVGINGAWNVIAGKGSYG